MDRASSQINELEKVQMQERIKMDEFVTF